MPPDTQFHAGVGRQLLVAEELSGQRVTGIRRLVANGSGGVEFEYHVIAVNKAPKARPTLGDEPTHDLVGWVNEAATVNRAEVRELADLYLSRFDERLERRLAEYDAKVERRLVELESRVDAKMTAGFAAGRVEMADRLSAQHRDLLRWLLVFWAGTIIPLAGLMTALIKL